MKEAMEKQLLRAISYARWLSNTAQEHREILDFSDHAAAFRSKKNVDLLRAYTILAVCSSDKIVDNSLQILRNGERWLGSFLFGAIMQRTFYSQFVGGETDMAVITAAKKLQLDGLRLMIAPTLESDIGDEKTNSAADTRRLLEYNFKELQRLAGLAGKCNEAEKGELFTESPRVCLQMKMTAIVPVSLLISMSNSIRAIHMESSERYVKLIESLAVMLQDCSKTEAVSNLLGFQDKQLHALQEACQRIQQIGYFAARHGIRLLVDMEWTYVNPACSALASAMMANFNNMQPVVCSTVQCYLKEALQSFQREHEVAQMLGACYGAKFVRGAYLEKERQISSTVWDSYRETCDNYDKILKKVITNALKAKEGQYFLVIATHNESSVLQATRMLQELNALSNQNIAFAQIYGMAEHISLPLAQSGYTVYKSVAFGTMNQVLPYLARRAAENRAIVRGARREQQLIRNEITRRARQLVSL